MKVIKFLLLGLFISGCATVDTVNIPSDCDFTKAPTVGDLNSVIIFCSHPISVHQPQSGARK